MESLKIKNAEIVFEGKRFVLPEDLKGDYDEAIRWLELKKAEDQMRIALFEEIKQYHPLDVLVAFTKATAELYGWTSLKKIPGGFFAPERPPMMVGVWVSPTELLQVPFGRLELPGIEGFLETGIETNPVPKFVISGEIKRKSLPKVQELVHKVREVLKSDSIYKGKTIKVSWQWERDGLDYSVTDHCPQFISLDTNITTAVFSPDVQEKLDIGLFTNIRYLNSAKKAGIPIKNTTLLVGEYGVGKTLVLYMASQEAEKNGITAVHFEAKDIAQGFNLMCQYAPAIGVMEDVERIVSGEKRTDQINEILNTVDGVLSKGKEVMMLMTTNHPELINSAMRRHGRIDNVIYITPPDATAAAELVLQYGGPTLNEAVDLGRCGEMLKGIIPATIRGVVETAKKTALFRQKGHDITGVVTEKDLRAAFLLTEDHRKFMEEGAQVGEKTKVLSIHLPPEGVLNRNSNGDLTGVAALHLKEEHSQK